MVYNVVAYAAHDSASQFTEPPGAHDDKCCILLLCDVADEFSGLLKVGNELASDLNRMPYIINLHESLESVVMHLCSF